MVKNITLDENAYKILKDVKQVMREEGFGSPSFSDAVRWLHRETTNGGKE